MHGSVSSGTPSSSITRASLDVGRVPAARSAASRRDSDPCRARIHAARYPGDHDASPPSCRLRPLRSRPAERVVVADGAMGTMLQAHDARPWTTSRASRAATRSSTSPGPTSSARPRRLLRGRRRLRRDQHLRRQPRQPRRVRHRRPDLRAGRGRRPARPRGRRRLVHAGPAALGARLGRPGHQAADARPRAVRRRCATPTQSRSPAWSPAGSTPSSSRPPRTCCRPRPRSSGARRARRRGRRRRAGLRAGHRRDDRHACCSAARSARR